MKTLLLACGCCALSLGIVFLLRARAIPEGYAQRVIREYEQLLAERW